MRELQSWEGAIVIAPDSASSRGFQGSLRHDETRRVVVKLSLLGWSSISKICTQFLCIHKHWSKQAPLRSKISF